ncbi:hypothetical protein BDB00DRAFT_869089 [Zychaea mexicana]|uniref:uncharacterized protein n=1 Tax=Zychaea mexicana TaxID=64656 RepID=UPI0022FE2CE9|nr:uncharacterized protein BDB00DRAFT_869089 [Zychaea mexicana]KAI9496859.1 hypothetical protein BDB00DRAFT_869089 [Zychaea mexicana]
MLQPVAPLPPSTISTEEPPPLFPDSLTLSPFAQNHHQQQQRPPRRKYDGTSSSSSSSRSSQVRNASNVWRKINRMDNTQQAQQQGKNCVVKLVGARGLTAMIPTKADESNRSIIDESVHTARFIQSGSSAAATPLPSSLPALPSSGGIIIPCPRVRSKHASSSSTTTTTTANSDDTMQQARIRCTRIKVRRACTINTTTNHTSSDKTSASVDMLNRCPIIDTVELKVSLSRPLLLPNKTDELLHHHHQSLWYPAYQLSCYISVPFFSRVRNQDYVGTITCFEEALWQHSRNAMLLTFETFTSYIKY